MTDSFRRLSVEPLKTLQEPLNRGFRELSGASSRGAGRLVHLERAQEF